MAEEVAAPPEYRGGYWPNGGEEAVIPLIYLPVFR